MSMNLSEFKQRLGADPGEQEPEHRLNRPSGPEFDAARREAAAFEAQLGAALDLSPPTDLHTGLLDVTSRPASSARRWLGVAAGLVIAAGAAGLLWNTSAKPQSLDEHVAWHFALDGGSVLEQATPNFDTNTARAILAQFNFQASPELERHIRFVKICPGFSGNSAHLAVQTESGLLSIFIMPGVQAPEHLVEFDGMRARLVSLGGGATAAIIGRSDQAVSDYTDMVRNALTRTS